MARSDDRTLTLVVSDTTPFVMELYDDADEVEDLSLATKAHLVVEESVGAATKLLDLSTEAPGSELAINTSANTITATMTTAQAAALVAGTYVAELAVLINGVWKHSSYFHVKVNAAVASNLA